MLNVAARRLKGSVASLALLGVLLVVLLAGVPPAAAGSGSYTENFTTTTYRDAAATNATGWGTGAIRLPHKAPILLGSYDTPGEAYEVEVVGGIAYVADAGSGLQVVNVTNPRQPTLLGTYDTPNAARGVAVAGGIAYVADQASGLQIINVTDPRTPVLLGSYDTPASAWGVAVVGGIAYVGDRFSGLQIINVTNPRQPTLLGTYNTPGLASGVAVAGGIAYVADEGNDLLVFNVTNPRNPTVLGGWSGPMLALEVTVVGSIVYLAYNNMGLEIINVTNPRNPTLLGGLDTPGDVWGVAVAGGIAYVGASTSGLQIVNVTDPRQPTLLAIYDTPGNALGVAVVGGVAYVADMAAGLQVVSIADFTPPALVSSLAPLNARGVAVVGGVAYLAVSGSGLQLINVTDPRLPTLLGTFATPSPRAVAVVGGVAYVAEGARLRVINVTDPRQPVLLGDCNTGGNGYGVAVVGRVAYVADRSLGLQMVNVTDPRQPTLLGTLATTDAWGVAVVGGIACVADYTSGLRVINVTDPRQPTLLGTLATSQARGVAVLGGIAYVADYSGGMHVVNVTNPWAPTFLSTLNVAGATAVAVAGTIAYFSTWNLGLVVVNVTNPRQPTWLGQSFLFSLGISVAVAGDEAYIGSQEGGFGGLLVMEVQRNRCRQYEPLAVAQSLTVATATSATLVRATLTCTQTLPSGTGIAYYLSPDAGTHWEAVTPGVEHVFTNVGAELRWRAVLSTTDTVQTPILTGLSVTFATRLIAPTLVSPLSGVTTGSTPTFQWTAVTGATSYLLQLDTASSFTSPNLRNVTLSGGTTSYTPTLPLTEGTWYWRVAANDSTGDLGAFSATWWLSVDATPPTWDQTPTNQVVQFSSGFRYDVNASDASGIQSYWVNDTVHFAIDSNGVVTNATGLPVGVHGLEVRAYDPYSNFCSATFTLTVQDTLPPTWDQTPTDQVLEYGSDFRYDVNASDPSGIAYYWVSSSAFTVDGAGVVTSVFSLNVWEYWIVVRAYDPYGHYCEAEFKLTVQDTIAPTWDELPTNQFAELGAFFRYDVNASDLSGIASYWLNDTAHFSITSDGIITTTAAPIGSYGLEVRAYDPYSHYCAATFTVTVRDTTPPTFLAPPIDLDLPYGLPVDVQFQATDLSGIDHWTVNDTVHFAISTTGHLTSITTLAAGRYGLTVTVYDPYNNGQSATFTLTVQAETTTTTPPPIPGFPWPAILLATVAALSLGVHRRRRQQGLVQ